MKRFFFTFVAMIIYVIQPANADTLWSCVPDTKNPSTKMLFINISDDKVSIFDTAGKEILVAPFDDYRTSKVDGLIVQARLHQQNDLMYSFSIAMNEARTDAKVMLGLTANDTTVFWDCK